MSLLGEEYATREALNRAAEEGARYYEAIKEFADGHGATLLCWVGQAYDADQVLNEHANPQPFPRAANGVCLALTTVWIRKNLLGQEPLEAFRNKLKARGITDAYRRKQSTPTARYDAADQAWRNELQNHQTLEKKIEAVQQQIEDARRDGKPVQELYKQKLALDKARRAANQEALRLRKGVEEEAKYLHANMVFSEKHFTGVPLGTQSVYAQIETGTSSAASLPRSLLPFVTTDGYYLLSFGPAGNGHVIGFTAMTHLPFRLFDPNTGEFEVPSGGAQAFMDAYWTKVGYSTVLATGDYSLHRFSHVQQEWRKPAQARVYPPVPWDHALVNRFCKELPSAVAQDRMPGGTTSAAVQALRTALHRSEYTPLDRLQVFVIGRDGQEWLGAVHMALEEAGALVRRKGYRIEVVPLERQEVSEVEVRVYRT